MQGQAGHQRETNACRDASRPGIPGRGRCNEFGLEQEAIANLADENDENDEGDSEPEQSHRPRLADLPAPVEHWVLLRHGWSGTYCGPPLV